MCGPSNQEKYQAAETASFASLLRSNYGQLFANQMDVLNAINRSLSPITAQGPNQHGYSPDVLAALNTQAINSTAAATRNAQQAARNFAAGQGGGAASPLQSGVQKQIEGSIAAQGANTLANEQLGIIQADYALGQNNYWRAMGGMQALAAGYNPAEAMSGSIDEGANAFKEADIISQEQNQKEQTIAGGIAALGMAGLTFGAGAMGGGGLVGGLRALTSAYNNRPH